MRRLLPLLTVLGTGVAQAAGNESSTGSLLDLLKVLLGLILVLALMAGLAWLMRGANLARSKMSGNPMRIVGAVSVGTRERVMIIEVADQWLVVGVTPTQISSLATMPIQPLAPLNNETSGQQFSSWLKNSLQRRQQSPSE